MAREHIPARAPVASPEQLEAAAAVFDMLSAPTRDQFRARKTA